MEVLLFGIVAEKAGRARLEVQASSLDALRAALLRQVPDLAGLSYAIAVDRCIEHGDRMLMGQEEIAVLPPFAGG